MKYLFTIAFIPFVITVFSQQPNILWWFDTDDSAFGQSAMGDIDGDGKPEITFGCYRNDSMVYALNAEDGSLLWKQNTVGFQEGCNDVATAIYDVDGDGEMEVIVPSSCNPFTYCFSGIDGSIIWKTLLTSGSDSPPVIADLDGDGLPEVLHGQFGGYVICLDAITGAEKWKIEVDTDSWIQTAPTVVDLNGDGILDIVVATWHFSDNNKVYAYNGKDQSLLWSLPVADVIYHGTAVADILNNGTVQLVIGDYSGTLYLINGADGSLEWTYEAGGYIGSPVSIADLDGDGACEMVFSSGSSVLALKGDATLLWSFPIPDFGQSFRGAALSDINDDALPDVIFGTDKGRLIALKGNSGQPLINLNLAAHYGKSLDINHAPVVGDFDQNGILDAFVVGGYTNFPEFQDNYGRGYAVELGQGAGPDWPMFQYDHHRTGSLCPVGSTAIDDVTDAQRLKISPNPVSRGQTIELGLAKDMPGGSLEIHTTTGIFVQQFSSISNTDRIEVNLTPGLYVVTVANENFRIHQRLVVTE